MEEKILNSVAAAHFEVILKAMKSDDYALFCSVMDDTMKNAISEQHFSGVCISLSPYFKVPFQANFMDELRGDCSHRIYFWKITSEGKPDDLLARIGIKNGLVSGLLFTPPFDSALKKK